MTTLSFFFFCLILLSEFLDIYDQFYMEYILNAKKKTKVSCESKYKFVET